MESYSIFHKTPDLTTTPHFCLQSNTLFFFAILAIGISGSLYFPCMQLPKSSFFKRQKSSLEDFVLFFLNKGIAFLKLSIFQQWKNIEKGGKRQTRIVVYRF